jgi:hypothetical protein
VNADVGAWLEIGLELVPQFRRLVFHVPLHVLVPRTEIALLGAGRLLVASDADNHAGELVLVQHRLERVFFQSAATFDPGGRAVGVGDPLFQHRLVLADNQLQLPLLNELVAILNHGRNLVSRVHVYQRERHVAQKRLARQPEHGGGILANAPEHGQVLEPVERLAQDINALIFQLGKGIHVIFLYSQPKNRR